MAAPSFSIEEIRCYERPVTLRLPFRFGAVTVTHAPQAFVRVRIRLADGTEAGGAAAELMVPKWFDKDPALSEAQSFDQLRHSLSLAREAYLADGRPRTAFGHFAAHYRELVEQSGANGLPPLAGCFGPAEIDKAIVDALGRALGHDFFELVQRNLLGIAPADLLREFAGFDFDAFAPTLAAADTIALRHTVGMLDAIEQQPTPVVDDGLPASLAGAIARYGVRYFKLKLGGRVEDDVARLRAIATLLERLAHDYVVTLDANEQYDDVAELVALWQRLGADRSLSSLRSRVAFVEQPIHRQRALDRSVAPLARAVPVIIDESDATLDAFPTARELGYSGVSTKACKGLYKSLLNRARCARWNGETGGAQWFMSAEDLTTQAGLAVQQDLALASVLGIAHVERNGHYYVNGFAGQHAPATEQEAFLACHEDLYERSSGSVRLRVVGGTVQLRSLGVPGFASNAEPDWASLAPLDRPASIAAHAS